MEPGLIFMHLKLEMHGAPVSVCHQLSWMRLPMVLIAHRMTSGFSGSPAEQMRLSLKARMEEVNRLLQVSQGVAAKIDYVHGQDIVVRLGSQTGNLGFFLPAMPKHDLFKTVILDGALPRKTFSMGEAREKRFYMEARRIS